MCIRAANRWRGRDASVRCSPFTVLEAKFTVHVVQKSSSKIARMEKRFVKLTEAVDEEKIKE